MICSNSLKILRLTPILGILSTGTIFLFTFLCIQYLHNIHYFTPFLHLIPPPPKINLPQAGPVPISCSWVLQKKQKEIAFLLVYDSYTGSFLWYFHVYVYYSLMWFISLFLLSTLIPFLWFFQQAQKFYVHS
jgi:hypothetical protein